MRLDGTPDATRADLHTDLPSRQQTIARLEAEIDCVERTGEGSDPQLLRDCLTLLRSSGWRAIASAPKDGTQILTWGATRGIDTAFYDPDPNHGTWRGDATGFSMDHEAEPTHWMPLPPAPADQEPT